MAEAVTTNAPVLPRATNLTGLSGRRLEVMVLGLDVAGSDGAPARGVARPID
jgi:hypothetical protein